MKVLILHNEYRQAGGEDRVVEEEARLLRTGGIEVCVLRTSNRQINGALSSIQTALGFLGWPKDRSLYMKTIEEFQPDVVHIHNFWPLITPFSHNLFAKNGLPVVQTLHNYRLVCANAQLFRDQKVCNTCVGGVSLWGVFYRCYRRSFLASLAVVLMQLNSRSKGWFTSKSDVLFLALTSFSREVFIQGGMCPENIVVKQNFISSSTIATDMPKKSVGAVLFVGRVSKEKGVEVLMNAARLLPNLSFRVVGDGPMFESLVASSPGNVTFVGALERQEVALEMRKASLLVVPSLWYEGFPMTILEAYSVGLPVVASNIGSLAEVVSGDAGRLFEPGDSKSLAETIKSLLSDDDSLRAMSESVSLKAATDYGEKAALGNLLGVYKLAIERNTERTDERDEGYKHRS